MSWRDSICSHEVALWRSDWQHVPRKAHLTDSAWWDLQSRRYESRQGSYLLYHVTWYTHLQPLVEYRHWRQYSVLMQVPHDAVKLFSVVSWRWLGYRVVMWLPPPSNLSLSLSLSLFPPPLSLPPLSITGDSQTKWLSMISSRPIPLSTLNANVSRHVMFPCRSELPAVVFSRLVFLSPFIYMDFQANVLQAYQYYYECFIVREIILDVANTLPQLVWHISLYVCRYAAL